MSSTEDLRLDERQDIVPALSPVLGLDEVLSGTARLLQLVEASSACRLSVSFGSVRWEVETAPPAATTVVATTVVADPAARAEPAAAAPAGHPVLAPVVGVFYASPRPGADPFVRVGDQVAAGQQVAIIEAMKMMNEIVADRSGVVRAVHPENEAVVEFGEPLFTLDPA